MKNEEILWHEYVDIQKFIDIVKKFDKESWDVVKNYIDENIDFFQEMNQLEKIISNRKVKLVNDLDHLKKTSKNGGSLIQIKSDNLYKTTLASIHDDFSK